MTRNDRTDPLTPLPSIGVETPAGKGRTVPLPTPPADEPIAAPFDNDTDEDPPRSRRVGPAGVPLYTERYMKEQMEAAKRMFLPPSRRTPITRAQSDGATNAVYRGAAPVTVPVARTVEEAPNAFPVDAPATDIVHDGGESISPEAAEVRAVHAAIERTQGLSTPRRADVTTVQIPRKRGWNAQTPSVRARAVAVVVGGVAVLLGVGLGVRRLTKTDYGGRPSHVTSIPSPEMTVHTTKAAVPTPPPPTTPRTAVTMAPSTASQAPRAGAPAPLPTSSAVAPGARNAPVARSSSEKTTEPTRVRVVKPAVPVSATAASGVPPRAPPTERMLPRDFAPFNESNDNPEPPLTP